MRELKFRAWNSNTKVMVDLYKITPLALSLDQDGLFIPFKEDWPLMQYTGLKDKNGVEIYEGDIIKVAHWSSTGKPCVNCGFSDPGEKNMPVEFEDGLFGMRSKQFDSLVEIEGKSDYEVIGNIYENPELLR